MPDGSLSLTIILSDLETWNAGAHVRIVWLSAHKCLGIVPTPTSFNRGGGVTSLAGEIYVLRPKERDEVEVYDVITSNDQIWHSNSYREQARRTWSRKFSKRPRFLRLQHTPTRYDIWTSTFCKMKFEVTFYRVHRAPDTLSRLGGSKILWSYYVCSYCWRQLTILLTYSVVWHSCISVSPAQTQFCERPSILLGCPNFVVSPQFSVVSAIN